MPAKLNILLIEDDQDDIEFLRDALKDNEVIFNLETVTRGDLILKYFEKKLPVPDIIIMDLNLPKMHGREVLCRIKEQEALSKVPLMVLTTSSLTEDKDYCLEKGADMFVSKPASPEGFNKLITTIVRLAGRKGKKNLRLS